MSSVTPETKQSLPSGHPRAGYTVLAHDAVADTGTVPDTEQGFYDDRVAAAEAQNQAVADHEDAVAKEEASEGAAEAATEIKAAKTQTKGTGSS